MNECRLAYQELVALQRLHPQDDQGTRLLFPFVNSHTTVAHLHRRIVFDSQGVFVEERYLPRGKAEEALVVFAAVLLFALFKSVD